MRYYPQPSPDFYIEFQECYQKSYNPKLSWKARKLQGYTTISYWRDYEGASLKTIKSNDLIFPDWYMRRRRDCAELPLIYYGPRYIRLEQDYPNNFGCTQLPMNLKELQEIEIRNAELQIIEEQKTKEEKPAGAKRVKK